jgi:antirestriction protein
MHESINAGSIGKAEEAYQGTYDSDEEFAQELAEEIGAVNHSASWPNNCIDWERAARDLMYDYFEMDGHYFSL